MAAIDGQEFCISPNEPPKPLSPEIKAASEAIPPFFIKEITCIPPVPEIPGEPLAATLVREIIGTGQCRSTASPSEEAQGKMRELTQKCIEDGIPIPILVPMGPKKPVPDAGVDVAEVCALKTLAALRRRILTRYDKGVHFYFREEDVTGWYLEGDVPNIREHIEKYISGFEGLVKALGYDSFMTPFRESELTDLQAYVDRSSKMEPLLKSYIEETDQAGLDNFEQLQSYKDLVTNGWQGSVPLEQREFYRNRYSFLYPDRTPQEIDAMMVRYLATTLARYQLHAAFPPEIANGHFQLNFAPPVPGSPKSLSTTRVYWRPLPISIHKSATPFWRARGYLKEQPDGSLCPNLASWQGSLPLTSRIVRLGSGDEAVDIQADILSQQPNQSPRRVFEAKT